MAELSQFERVVLNALVRKDPESEALRAQLADATAVTRDYTGVGLYTKLSVLEGAPKLHASSRYIEEVPRIHLEHPLLPAGAGAILWIKDGLAHTLECYTYDGEWPEDESSFVVHDDA
jgi:hypothetical protein